MTTRPKFNLGSKQFVVDVYIPTKHFVSTTAYESKAFLDDRLVSAWTQLAALYFTSAKPRRRYVNGLYLLAITSLIVPSYPEILLVKRSAQVA